MAKTFKSRIEKIATQLSNLGLNKQIINYKERYQDIDVDEALNLIIKEVKALIPVKQYPEGSVGQDGFTNAEI